MQETRKALIKDGWVGCSKCKGFEPKEEFKANYKDFIEEKRNV